MSRQSDNSGAERGGKKPPRFNFDLNSVEIPIPLWLGAKNQTPYSDSYCDLVIGWGAQGKSLTYAAGQIGVTKRKLDGWRAENPDFDEACALAETLAESWWEEAGQQALSATNFQSGLWNKVMAARFGANWRDTVRNEHTGKDGEPLELARTDLMKLIEAKMAALQPRTIDVTPASVTTKG